MAGGGLRRAGFVSGGSRIVRRDRLLSEPADSRDWNPHGARSYQRFGLPADSERGGRMDGAWNWSWPGGVAGRNVSDAQLAVWSAIVGSDYFCRGDGHSGGCRTRGQLSSRAPCGSRESNGRVAGVMTGGQLPSVSRSYVQPGEVNRSRVAGYRSVRPPPARLSCRGLWLASESAGPTANGRSYNRARL